MKTINKTLNFKYYEVSYKELKELLGIKEKITHITASPFLKTFVIHIEE